VSKFSMPLLPRKWAEGDSSVSMVTRTEVIDASCKPLVGTRYI